MIHMSQIAVFLVPRQFLATPCIFLYICGDGEQKVIGSNFVTYATKRNISAKC